MPGDGWGKLKKIASAISLAEIPNLVKDLDKASYEERERQAALLDVVALQQASNPAALVSAGAIKVLVELVSSGSDGAQIHSASTLATIAASKHEYQDMVVAANAIPTSIVARSCRAIGCPPSFVQAVRVCGGGTRRTECVR